MLGWRSHPVPPRPLSAPPPRPSVLGGVSSGVKGAALGAARRSPPDLGRGAAAAAGGRRSRTEREMKSSLRSRQEPRRVSNGVIIGAMLLSLCVLSIVKARYCATPFGASRACAGCVRAFVRHLSSRPFPSSVWRWWWGLRLTLLWCGSCRQGRGPARGADELQHPDGAGGVVAGQDARRSVFSALLPESNPAPRVSNLSEIRPPHGLR